MAIPLFVSRFDSLIASFPTITTITSTADASNYLILEQLHQCVGVLALLQKGSITTNKALEIFRQSDYEQRRDEFDDFIKCGQRELMTDVIAFCSADDLVNRFKSLGV